MKIRNTLTSLEENLKPAWPEVRNTDTLAEGKQEFYNNHRNKERNLPALRIQIGQTKSLDQPVDHSRFFFHNKVLCSRNCKVSE